MERHLKVIVHEVDNEVREPWVFSLWFKEPAEEAKTFLTEMVTKDFERHQCAVLAETLSEERQSKILNVIVCHIEMNQRSVHGEGLRDGFGSVIRAFVVCKVKWFKGTVFTFQVFWDGLASSERNFIRVEIEDSKRVILQQVLHHDVDAIISQFVLLQAKFLQAYIVLEHLSKVDRHTLTDSSVYWIIYIELL